MVLLSFTIILASGCTVEFVHEPAGSEVDLFLFWTLLGVEPDIAQQLAERRIFSF